MSNYRVYWRIDICAGSPKKAAETALRILRDTENAANVFEVIPVKDGFFQHSKRKVVELRSTDGKDKSKKSKG